MWLILLLTAVAESLPSFHAKMQNRLRTPAQGADTAVWLTLSPAAKNIHSGDFFQGNSVTVFGYQPNMQ